MISGEKKVKVSRLSDLFRALRERGEGGLVAFLVAGDPDKEHSFAFLEAAAKGGADVLEIGMAFSDPLADGPVIQTGCQRALAAGIMPRDALDFARRLREKYETGLVVFSCYNLLLQYGLESFAREAAAAGVDGVLVTDLPPEEAGAWHAIARENGLDTIFLVSPTTHPARIEAIAKLSSGFIYAISRMGVTGARTALPADLPALVEKIRAHTDLPLAIGFGLSTPEQIAQVCRVADAAVVGSALVAKSAESSPEALKELVASLKAATKPPK